MKKRALYLLAVMMMVLAASAVNIQPVNGDGPPPLCNPFTDPTCK